MPFRYLLLLIISLLLICTYSTFCIAQTPPPTVLTGAVNVNLSPFLSSGSDVSVSGCQLTVQGLGYLLLNLISSSNTVTYSFYQYISSPSIPVFLSCSQFPVSSISVSTVIMASLTSPLILSSIQLVASQSPITLLSIDQTMPYYGYFSDPLAVAFASGTIQSNLAPFTSYKITAVSNNGGEPLRNTTNISGSLSWNVSLAGLIPNTDYRFSVRSYSGLPDSYPVQLISEELFFPTLLSYVCPPGYYTNLTETLKCSQCPLGSVSVDYNSTCIACEGGFTSLIGSSYCADALTHWSFDTEPGVNEILSFYDTQYAGGGSNTLSISTNQRVFGNGSLYSDGSSAYGLDVKFFLWFCYYSENCWQDAREQNSWSVTFWFQPTIADNSRIHTIISSGLQSSGMRYHGYFSGSPLSFIFDAYGPNRTSLAHIQSDPGIVNVNQWVFIGLVWNQVNGLMNLYVNGSLHKTNTFNTSVLMRIPNTNYTNIGYSNSSSNSVFVGFIDELWYWTGDLNATRIASVMNNNTNAFNTDGTPSIVNWFDHSAILSDIHFRTDLADPPESYYVNPIAIKDQGDCEWCVAYSHMTLYEFSYHRYYHERVELSAREPAACSKYFPCKSQKGDIMYFDRLRTWIQDNGYLGKLCYYDGYLGGDSNICALCLRTLPMVNNPELVLKYIRFNDGDFYYKGLSQNTLEGYDRLLRQTIIDYGPVAVNYNAQAPWFQYWKKSKSPYLVQSKPHYKYFLDSFDTGSANVYTLVDFTTECIQNDNTHRSVIIGWTKNTWIIQNSWGENLGEKGIWHVERKTLDGKYVNFCGIYFEKGWYWDKPGSSP